MLSRNAQKRARLIHLSGLGDKGSDSTPVDIESSFNKRLPELTHIEHTRLTLIVSRNEARRQTNDVPAVTIAGLNEGARGSHWSQGGLLFSLV